MFEMSGFGKKEQRKLLTDAFQKTFKLRLSKEGRQFIWQRWLSLQSFEKPKRI